MLAKEAFDRGLLAVDEGGHDLSIGGIGLTADDHEVSVEYPGADHGLALHSQHEDRARADQCGGERHHLVDVFDREQGGTRRHPSEYRNLADAVTRPGGLRLRQYFDGPRFARVLSDHSCLDECGQMGVNR